MSSNPIPLSLRVILYDDENGKLKVKLENALFFTFLTVRFTLLHVKCLVPDGSLAGCTLKTLNVVGHLQGMHDFLTGEERGFFLAYLV